MMWAFWYFTGTSQRTHILYFGRLSDDLCSEMMKSKFKSKLNNLSITEMAGELSQNMGFKALINLPETLGKI